MKDQNWHNQEVSKVFLRLNTGEPGIPQDEVKQRSRQFGLNKLPSEKPIGFLVVLLSQFKSPLIFVLVIAAVVSWFLGEFVDAGVISIAVVANTIIGFIQENKANRAVEKLRSFVHNKARVRRGGEEMIINAEEVIPGDILILEEGQKIAADARLIKVVDLETNEAPLTGESMPVTKGLDALDVGTVLAERSNMVYMGTMVSRGHGEAVVTAIGKQTHLGEIASLVKKTAEEKTPLQEQLSKFGRFIGIAVVVAAIFIFVLGIAFDHSVYEMFLTAVALAVAAIPEGLLVAVTAILAIGMQRILRKKALVRKLVAAETLGGVSVICMDKTGTLTLGQMKVDEIMTVSGRSHHDSLLQPGDSSKELAIAFQIATLCNNAVVEGEDKAIKKVKIFGEPTEKALVEAAIGVGIDKNELEAKYKRLDEVPFESSKKYMATLVRWDSRHNAILVKGAPDVIFNMADEIQVKGETKKLTKSKREDVESDIVKMTTSGLRTLGVMYKIVPKDHTEITDADLSGFTFVGVYGLKDPLRAEAKDTVRLAKMAGIRPVIITGDHKLTAKMIAQEVGLTVDSKRIVDGEALEKMDDDELHQRIREIDIYARVEPKHKLRIIDAWQAAGEVVAMTGDGVNDAPALKSADIGVALGSGTDVAKETSDIILLDNNFKTIVEAVRQGRVIFENIRKVIVYLLSDSFSEIILIGGALLFGFPLPILPAQILWINLITDGFPDIALTAEPGEKGIMKDKPRKRKSPILNQEMKILIFIIGILTDLGLFGLFLFFWKTTGDIEYTRTIVFAALGIDSLFYVFSVRSLRKSIFRVNPFSNKYLVAAVFAGLGLQILALYHPFLQKALHLQSIGWFEWVIVIIVGIVNIILIEIVKEIYNLRKRRKLAKIT